jgi:hypothetical protein
MEILKDAHNDHDTGTSKWGTVSAENATTTPLISNNSTGTNNIAELRDNGTAVVTVADGGTTTFAPGGTTKAVINSSGIVLSNSATIAMGSAKITGLADGSASGDAIHFGQFTTGGIVTEPSNGSASAGDLGEVIESAQTTQQNLPSSTQWGDLTSISLTAGNWLVSAFIRLNTSTSTGVTEFGIGISSTSGNSSSGLTEGNTSCTEAHDSSVTGITNQRWQLAMPAVNIKLASTTTHYLKMTCTYSNGQPVAVGRITAVRIR